MLWKLTATTLMAAAMLVTASCQSGDAPDEGFPLRVPEASPTTSSGPVIGLVGSMSGEEAWLGEDAFEGVDVAVQALNRDTKPSEQPFTLVGLDDEGNPERATELIEELAGSDRTVGIVYAGPPEGLAAAEPHLAQAGIPAVLVHGDLYSARLLRPHLFQVSAPLLWQARRIADYLLTDRDYRRVAVLAEDSLAGDTAVDSARRALELFDGRAAAVVRYPSGDSDLSDELTELRSRDVEAIVFQGVPAAARLLFDELSSRDESYISTLDARTVTATKKERKRAVAGWHPQIAGFDGIIHPATGDDAGIPPGVVAADTYARGAFQLPIPSFREFREDYVAWWDDDPTGWQLRAYEAAMLVGWAARRSEPGEDIAITLESISGERFGGLDISFGPDDHTSVIPTTVGLWVVPREGSYIGELDLPESMPWVMLARGFSTNGKRTDVLPKDWEELFRGIYRPDGPAPRLSAARFAVATPASDPVH